MGCSAGEPVAPSPFPLAHLVSLRGSSVRRISFAYDGVMELLFGYMGKADAKRDTGPHWHPLVWHGLDVAAVAVTWLDTSAVVRAVSLHACGLADDQFPRLRAWAAFYIALHDLGKFHTLFQWALRQALGESAPPPEWQLMPRAAGHYRHGQEGLNQFFLEYSSWIGGEDEDYRHFDAWLPWMQAVTGHHGELYEPGEDSSRYASDARMVQDRAARAAWVRTLAVMFLQPAGLSLADLPPPCSAAARTWFAGLCSVSDWIGSNTDVFPYVDPAQALGDYFNGQRRRLVERGILAAFGLVAVSRPYAGVAALLGAGEVPRGVQTLVDALPAQSGLTLIEAPTGSGKTEAALAYAWRLIEAGVAESVVFALPTQATANGMLRRAEAFGIQVFGVPNVVLAHGKRDWTEDFQRLLAAVCPTAQGSEEAAAQCVTWLAQSRKRVFLGQIGVGTIDQALLAVLPVRHKFVRGFGIQRSVLIVDEVHAYDSYMHGLLGELLAQQRGVGGSAILLSATLPSRLRRKLLAVWAADGGGEGQAPYPVVWHAGTDGLVPLKVAPEQQPERRVVAVERQQLPDATPGEALLVQLVQAARDGARVGVVLNRVDAAQQLARRLRQAGGDVAVDIFHSRYRYCDRRDKERAVLERYGRDCPPGGRILVATQVVEQSLDLDFDWLLTQICPVDLLFQRLGRLHRHKRLRPPGFERPRCTVLTVDGDDYGSHALIYGNTRVLWRTDRLLSGAAEIVFPHAYREWIEQVYEYDDWPGEPTAVSIEFGAFRCKEIALEREAIGLTRTSMTQFRDEDGGVLSLTRGDEMGLTVLPLTVEGRTLDGDRCSDLDERARAEVTSLQGIPVPATGRWKRALANGGDEEGRFGLVMVTDGGDGWVAHRDCTEFRYGREFGLEMKTPGVARPAGPAGAGNKTVGNCETTQSTVHPSGRERGEL